MTRVKHMSSLQKQSRFVAGSYQFSGVVGREQSNYLRPWGVSRLYIQPTRRDVSHRI